MEEGSRWTCEACGCNTNASSDTNCGICGTSQSGPSILRRAGYSAARAAWLARPRGANSNRLDDLEEEHDLWESVVHGISDELILDGADRGRFVESTRQRFLDAARAFAHRNGAEAAPSVDPDVVWEAATTNTYSPYWMSSSGSEIEVGEGNERRHLAHVPSGSGEGQAIRAEHPLPRNSTVGFRVAFEHPTAEVAGANMGGCYLVGVTTSSFSAWSENKGLQNSPFFFGIEDGGLLYEGSSRTRREAEVSSQNSHGVLFGSRDVVTCISDGRTLTFWRNDTLLGTLVNSLPRSLPLFPVVVPFNSEVTVAITNVQSDPLPILRTFAVDWKKVQQEKEGELRARLAAQRSVLIQEDGSLSARLRDVLRSIFDMHEPHHDRLWYRCGWKLEKLQEITQGQRKLTFEDFCSVIERVVIEDLQKDSSNEKANECQEGDKVELVNGYEKFGDAKGGPLQVGDRGIVVDIQRGQNGEQRSIRVLHNSRRWYYQPQAIRSERSGLIECTSVWFLRDILRSHGFDHTTLDSLVGKPVTESSWRVGDIVVPKDSGNLMGRIVAASKEKDAVKVQYSNPAFLEAVGLPEGDPLEVCRVENCRLKHSTVMDVAAGDAGIQDGGQNQEKLASSSDKTRSDICSLSRLERIDIDALVKECRRSSDSLASLFAGGLPDAFLSALAVAERLMNSLEPPDDLAERISAVGDLAIAIADQLFGDPLAAPKIDTEDPGSNDSTQGETSDLARTRQRARLSHRNRRLRLIRETSRHGEEDLDRRSMLLSLVSRGGRRTGSRFLNEDRPVPHLLGSPGDLFGESWDMAAALSSANNSSRARGTAPASDSQAPTPQAPCEDVKPRSFLDSILRCRGDLSQIGAKQGGTADHHAFVRQLVQDGIVADNVDWTKALIEAQSEKTNRRIPAILRSVSDEEGTPLLYLAVLQRCSPEMIGRLLDWGAPSRPEEVHMAAETDQPASLSLILQRSPLQDVDLDVDAFSQSVKEVFENSKVRQLELEKAMTEAAGKFMVDILHKLFELALCSRRLCSDKMESCGRVVCEVLVGNVLLTSVQKSQSGAGEHKDDSDCPEDANLGGLLGLLPRCVLADCLFLDKSHITTFLLVCEEYLCGKDMTDIASGLTMLFVLLRSFSHLSASPMVVRFGLDKFVARHQSLASDRITKIVSKRGNSDPSKQSSVLCPKNHVAVLHITRHSSFRCDLCGNGVDRGCPMHGCRQCDWDACEKCTDAAETGLVKCKVLKDLSSLCQEYLSTTKESDFTDEESTRFTKTLDHLSTSGSAAELTDVISRLKNRHVSALSDLAALLLEPGSVTIHEFVSIVLPALHGAFVVQTIPACGGRQSKKAKVSELEGRPSEGHNDLLEFCQDSLLELTADHAGTSSETEKQEANENAMDSESSDNEKNEVYGTETDSSTPVGRQNGKVDISYCTGASEILRRLHQVLSFHEGVLESLGSSPKCNELQALKAPIELKISPSTFNNTTSISCGTSALVHAEPLVPIGDICRHVLRTYRITDNEYVSFCRRLANEKAIIVDRPKVESARWRIARVLSFDEASGANTVQYATSWKRGCESDVLNVDSDLNASALFRFSGPTSSLVLAARQYFVFCRTPGTANSEAPSKTTEPEIQAHTSPLSHIVGTRVESNCEDPNEWIMYTVVAVNSSSNCTDTSSGSFVLVSDDGQVFSGISAERIRTQSLSDIAQEESTRARRSGRLGREDRHGLFPFFARQRGETSAEAVASSTTQLRALKRSWSALGLVDEMHPVDLQVVEDDPLTATDGVVHSVSLPCSLDDAGFHLVAEVSSLEAQPEINISFSCHEKLPGLDVSDKQEATLIWALREISHKQEKAINLPPESPISLHFSLKMNPDQCRLTFPPDFASVKIPASKPPVEDDWMERPNYKSRKLSSRSLSQEELDTESLVCDGFDSTCVECMEVLTVLSECAENPSSSTTRDGPKLPGLANTTLSKKLSDQLDDPVRVIGGALPHWCLKGPSFAPCVFAYETRRALLERAAFGVSRSTLKQQEAKVNVQRLRQRMASLRSKAVELVGEAFSGGAEDPTALQLQADELYGMEEALAMKVRAAFRAQNWQEHSLQVAKVAVRRENLISDAAAAMEKYSTDSTIRMRRLEVRFSGESGFDAASGDEAGVTRGFYADCAEALLSADNVASVYCSSSCLSVAAVPDISADKTQPMAVEEHDKESPKLPLWIPDMDHSNQVVIPTPRVNKRSGPGIFPRPLPNYHPQHGEVLSKFRLMGRLFAAAMRDGFMFPLPLSSSFLKLVQNCCSSRAISATHVFTVLGSEDLPRPGFLGGEVYGAESTVCKALDELDAVDPPLSRVQLMRRCEDIAKDKDFARKALGKTYDCSFDEYFQDRTFVDPFDPGQGADAVPLCSKGASKPVTIYNIREWVALSKRYILHEGVLEQAKAFRSGIKDFFPPEYLSLFTPLELQNDVCGVGDQVDNWDEAAIRKLFKLDGGKGAAEALVAVAAIGGEGGAALSRRFGPSSPTIGFLVNALKRGSPTQRRQFLSFVTSVPIVTPGNIEIVPILSPSGEFLPMSDPCCLPRANTCTRRLYLPKFDDFDSFEKVLWAVVSAENQFKGFWEWGG